MSKKAIAAVLCFITVFTLAINISAADIAADKKTLSGLSAQSAVLIDASSRKILYAGNENKEMPMASTTKIMTALVAAENYELKKEVEVSPEAVGVEGSSVYLRAGEKLTMEELLYAMLLESANDAAAAIAIAVGGSIPGFCDMMNAKAEELGLSHTHFMNPHGLAEDGHYTTAYELAVISSYAIENPTVKTIVSTKKRTIPMDNGSGVRLLINHNKMLRLYDGAIGVKTGFTRNSGRCLVSAAERDGLTLIAVTLNAPDDWNDHAAMLDYGFGCYENIVLASPGSLIYQIPVTGGKESYVTTANTKALSVTLPKGHGEITTVTETLHRIEFAPVPSGTVLGRVKFMCDGQCVGECELISISTVEKAVKKKKMMSIITGIFPKAILNSPERIFI